MLQQQGNQDSTPVPWSRLYPKTFDFHFQNLNSYGRKSTFLCFEVETWEDGSFLDSQKGVFRNQFYPKKPVHAEICFLNWFKTQPAFLAQHLAPEEKCHVTWFMSWSPCFQCAGQVAAFLRDHPSVQLSIRAARLYYPRRPQFQQGLRSLQGAGAQVAVMTPADFAFCWDMFVGNPKKRFWYWKGIYMNSCSLSKSLEDILRNPEN